MAFTFDPISMDNLLNAAELVAGFSISGSGAAPSTTFNIDVNGTLFSVTSDMSGDFTLNLTPADLVTAGIAGSGMFAISGDDGTGLASTSITTDVSAPTVVSMGLDDTSLIVGENATFTIVFSEAIDPTTLSSGDFNVQSGSLSSLATSDNITWTATFYPTISVEDATNVIELTGIYADFAGNTGATGDQTANYNVDTDSPIPNFMTLDNTNLSVGETATLTVVFSSSVDPATLDIADFTVENGVLSGLATTDNITWTATFTPTAGVEDASNKITLNNTYADASGNSGTGNSTNNYTVDTIAPIAPGVSLDTDSGVAADGQTNDATVDVTGLEVGGTWEYRIDDGSGFPATWTTGVGASFDFADDSDSANDGSYNIEVRQYDAANNVSSVTAATYVLDTSADSDATALSVAFVNDGGDMIYNGMEPVAVELAGLDADATALVTITSDGGGSVAVSGVAADGTITLDGTQMTMLSDGALTVSVVATDDAGNMAAPVSTNSFSLDTMSPTLVSAVFSDIDGTNGEISDLDVSGTGAGVTLTLTFSEDMDTSVNPTIMLSTGELTETGRVWNAAGDALIISYSVADNNTEVTDITVDVSGAADVAGNALTAVMGVSTGGTDIDTLNPLDETGSVNIDENADGLPVSLGSANGDVVATFDTSDGVTYAFDVGGDAGGAFDIVGNQLVVLDETLLDRESNAVTLTVSIIATDNAGNETAFNYAVNLDDVDDAPVIGTGVFAATVNERIDVTTPLDTTENDPADFGTFGSIEFTDDDITDSHSVSVTNISSTSNVTALNDGTFYGVFLAGQADPANGDGEGRIDWTFGNVTPLGQPNQGTPLTAGEMAVIDSLGAGEYIEQVFRITVTDFTGLTPLSTTQDVTIRLEGTNDAPVISVGGSDSDSAALPETDAVLSASGTLSLSDVDTTDVVDVVSDDTAVAVSGTFAGTNPLSTGDLQAMFSADVVALIDGTETSETINWTFDSTNADDFDFLATGETLILTYTVTATDDSGAMNDEAAQTVTITITGTNDAPIITTEDLVGAVTEDDTTPDLTDSGTIEFTDVDLSDSQMASAAFTLTSHTSQLGSLTASVTTATSGGLGGVVTWNYTVSDAAVQFLAQGETISETYTVTLTDGTTGDEVTRDVVVTITGTNDDPVLSGAAATIANVNEGSVVTVTTAELLQGWSDVDLSNTLSVDSLTASNGATITYDAMSDSYTITSDVDFNGTVTLSYNVTDGVAPQAASLSYEVFAVADADTVNTQSNLSPTVLTAGGDLLIGSGIPGDDNQWVVATDSIDAPGVEIGLTAALAFSGGQTVDPADASGFTYVVPGGVRAGTPQDGPASFDDGVARWNVNLSLGADTDSNGGALSDRDYRFEIFTLNDDGTVNSTIANFTLADYLAAGEASGALAPGQAALILAGNVYQDSLNFEWLLDAPAPFDLPFDFDPAAPGYYRVEITAENLVNGSDEVSAHIDVRVNTTPDAMDDSDSTIVEAGYNMTGTATATGNVLSNDTDADTAGTADAGELMVTEVVFGGNTTTLNAVGTTTIAGTYGDLVISQDGSWTYTLSDSAAATQALTGADTPTEVFTYTVTDPDGRLTTVAADIIASGTNTSTLTIGIQGTNDGPVAVDLPAGTFPTIDEDDSFAGTLVDTPTGPTEIPFSMFATDVDSILTASSFSFDNATIDSGTPVTAAIAGVAYDDTTGAFSFDGSVAAYQYLAENETVDLVVNFTVTDDQGVSDTGSVTFTIRGTNDLPTIGIVDADDAADGSVTESDAVNLTVSDTLTITDVDLTDLVSVSVASVTVNAGSDNSIANNVLEDMMTLAGDLDATETSDQITWTFDSDTETFDYLGAGESLVLDYVIEVTDGTATAQQTVQVTINGTNDRPEIAAGDSADLDEQTGATGSATLLSGSGTLALSDDDVSDVHSITDVLTSAVWDDGTGTNTLGDLTSGLPANLATAIAVDAAFAADNNGVSASNNIIDWAFNLADSEVDFLAAGETLTITYTITANDGEAFDGTDGSNEDSESASQTVVITLTGTNDVPTLAAESFTIVDNAGADDFALTNADTASGIETTANGDFSVISGTLDGDDVDLSDTLTYSVDGVAIVGGETSTELMGLLDGVMVSFGTLTVMADGSYTFEPNHANINALDETSTGNITVSATIRIEDNGGLFATSTFSIALDGANDDPVIITPPTPFAPLVVTEFADNSAVTGSIENTDNHVQSLTITFDDAEIADTHTATIVPIEVSGITPTTGDFIGTFSSGFPDVATGAGTGTVTFQFTVNDAVLDNLTEGETITQTYQLLITDDAGGSVTENITVTIKGTNDEPVILATTDAEDLTISELTNMTGVTTALTASGNIDFQDVDLNSLAAATGSADAHTIAASFTSATYTQTDTTVVDLTGDGAIGAITFGAITDDSGTGTGSDHSVNWGFSVQDQAVDFLAAGETLEVVYTVTINDGSGAANATTTQDITLLITGSNDVPEITSGVSAPVTETTDASAITTDISVNFTDADLTDIGHSSSVTMATSSGVDGGLSGVTLTDLISVTSTTKDSGSTLGNTLLNFNAASTVFDYLAATETVTITYTLQVADGDGGTTTETFDVVITGTNDAPLVTAVNVAGSILEGTTLSDNGSITFTDVDLTDLPTATEATQSVTALGQDGSTVLTLTAAQQADIEAAFTIDNVVGNTNNGTVTWDYTVAESALDFLGEGEVVTAIFRITVADGKGGSDFEDVTVMITGSNDAPNITIVDVAGDIEEGVTLSDSGSITFADVDLTDLPSATEMTSMVTATLDDGITALTLSAAQIADLEAAFTIENVAGNTNDGTVTWDYTIADTALDFLAQDETVTAVFTITVTDDENVTATQDVTITITGTNDAPTIVAGSTDDAGMVTEIVDNSTTPVEGSGLSADGTITFADLDLTDTHSAAAVTTSAVDNDGNPMTAVGTFTLGNLSTTGTGNVNQAADTVDWTFDVSDSVIDYLNEDETITQVYTVTISDGHGGSVTQDVTVVITGTNDAPVITAVNVAGTILEGTTLSDNGSITFADVDLTDLPTATEATQSVTALAQDGSTVLTLTAAQQADIEAAFTIENVASNTNNGTVTWDYMISEASLDFLGEGEVVTAVFRITVTDDNGATAFQDVTVTITGSNDAPVITAGDVTGDIEESVTLSDSGSITFADVDLTDLPSATEMTSTVTATLDDGTTPLTLSAAQIADLEAAFTIENVAGNTNDGTVTWDYTISETALDFLAQDETVTAVFTITVTDDEGDTDTQDVTITITGTNDAPTIVAGSTNAMGAITEVVEGATMPAEGDNLSDTGTITFADVDLTDTHTASVTASTTDHTSALGLFTLSAVDQSADTVEWTFDIDDDDINFLNQGEMITQTYTVTINDGHGGTVDQIVTVVITGTNDAPVIAAESFTINDGVGPVDAAIANADGDNLFSQDDLNDPGDLTYADDETYTVTGQLDATDSDATAVLTFNINGQTIAGGETSTTLSAMFNGAMVEFGVLTVADDGSYVFIGNADALNALDLGDAITLSTMVDVFDDNGASDTDSFTITLNGVNDAPIAIDDAIGAVENSVIDFNVLLDDSGDLSKDFDAEGHTLTVTHVADNNDSAIPANIGTNGAMPGTYDAAQNANVGALAGTIMTDWGATVRVEQNGDVRYNMTSGSGAFDALGAGDTAIDTFSYTIMDTSGLMSTATVSVTITGVNDQIFANSDDIAATENDAMGQTGNLLANDMDVDLGDTKDIVSVIAGANSSVTTVSDGMGGTIGFDVDLGQGVTIHVLTNGTYTVDIPESLAVTDSLTGSFSYTVEDSGGLQSSTTVSFTVNGANDDVIVDNAVAATMTEDDSMQSVDLLSGTSDVDTADILSVVAPPTLATGSDTDVSGVTFNAATNSFDIDPSAYNYLADGEAVILVYDYQVTDSNGSTVAQQATLTISGINDAPIAVDITETVGEDDMAATVITANFTDVDTNDTHTFTIDDTGLVGLVTNNNDGTFSYDPNGAFESLALGETATDSFTYTVDDGKGGTSTATATVTITGANDAPIATAVMTSVAEDGPAITITASFSDVDTNDTHTFTMDTTGTAGSVINNGDGTFSYDPNGAFEGLTDNETAMDTFTYTVTDNNGESSTQTVTVTINGSNDAPNVVSIDPVTLVEGNTGTADVQMIDIFADLVTVTDADTSDAASLDNSSVVVASAGGAPLGLVSNVMDGMISYDLADFDYLAVGESAVYEISFNVISGPDTVLQTVMLTITGENDGPVANAVAAAANEDGPTVTITADYSDVDASDTHIFTMDTTGTLGAVTNNGDGTFSYDPNGAFETLANGVTTTDTFTYTVDDGNGGTATETVTITITGQNDAPILTADVDSATDDSVAATGNVLTNDNDVDATDNLTVSNAGTLIGTYGTLTLNIDGSYSYVVTDESIDTGFTGTDVFDVDVTDGIATVSTTLTLNITGQNDAPVVTADVDTATDDSVAATGNVLSNDNDPDALDMLSVTNAGSFTGMYGTLTLNGDGSYSYIVTDETLSASFTGTDVFAVNVFDGDVTVVTSLTFDITGSNDAPVVAAALTAAANEDDTAFTIDMLAGATDVDSGTMLTVENVTGLVPGVTFDGTSTLSINPLDAAFQSLAMGETQIITIDYEIDDGDGGIVLQSATITITGTNDAPVAAAIVASISEDGPAEIITADFIDVDTNDTHTFTMDVTGTVGSVTNNGDGTFSYDPNGAFEGLADGETATDSFTYTVDDGNGGTSTETVTITISGQNDAPVALAVAGNANENGGSITVSADFTDVDATDTHIFSFDDTLTLGAVSDNGDGTFDYDPNGQFEYLAAGETATDSFTYTVDDGKGGTSTATVTITITGQNDAPVALAVAASANEDGPSVTISADFTDVDISDTHSFAVDTTGTLGAVVNNNDGTFSYNANGQFEHLAVGETAFDTFTYTVSDGQGGTSTETVTITVTGQNDAPTVAAAVRPEATEDDAIFSVDLLQGASDVDTNDTLNVANLTLVTGDIVGITIDAGGNSLTVDPNAYNSLAVGEESVITYSYEVVDGNGGSVTQIATITITGENDDPVAVAIAAAANEDGPTITVTADFTDVDTSDTHTFSVDTTGTLGTVTNNGDGTFTYDPNGAFEDLADGETATDTFTYTVTDNNGGSSTETVTITLTGGNDAPVALAVAAAAYEDGPVVTISADFTDADVSDTHTFAIDTTGTIGAVVNNNDGTFSYDPNGMFETLAAGETATDSFTYTVTDNNGASSTETVTVTITGQNDGPVAVAVVAATDEDGPMITVSANFSDVDTNDTHTFSVDTTGTLGVVTNIGDGTFDYNPNGAFEALAAGETTTDSFTYTVTDNNGLSSTETITVTITGQNDAPVALAVTGAADEDGPIITVSADFTDIDGSDTHTFSVDMTGTLGSVTNNGDGTFDYDPNGAFEFLAVGETTTDTFTYTVDDGNGGTSTETITITITGQNDAPVALDVAGMADEDGTSITITADFTDVDVLDTHTFSVDTTGTVGSVTNNGDGTFEYDPTGFEALALGETTTDTFTYTVDDGNGGTSTATVTITITGTNDEPDAVAIVGSADEDGPVITVMADFTDADTNDTHTFSVDTTGTVGSVTNNGDGTFDYDPNGMFESLAAGETTTDTFTYTVDDGNGGTSTATATITITGQNDGPVAAAVAAAANEDGPAVTIDVNGSFTDVDTSDTHTFTVDDTGTLGSVTNNGDGTFSYDSNGAFESLMAGETTTDTFTYTVDDGNGGTSTETVTVTITGTNDGATIGGTTTGVVDENTGVSAMGTLTATDVDNDDDMFQANAAAAAYGSFTVDIMGNWTYTVDDANAAVNALNDGETLTDSFDVLTTDGTVQTITITINGGNDSVIGTPNVDNLIGGEGIDVIFGLESDDTLMGNGDDDILEGGAGADILDGGTGNDTASYTTSDEGVTINLASGLASGGHATGDSLTSIENITGSAFNDTLIGDSGDNVLDGGAGNDTLTGGAGTNTLIGGDGSDRFFAGIGIDAFDGGTGFDTVDYRASTAGIVLSLDTGGTGGDAAGDSYISIERLYGTDFNDTINGSAANEFLYGEGGNDTINGGGGIDRIYGGDGDDIQRGQEGNDTLYGSAGADQLNGGVGLDIANYSLSTSRVELNLTTGGTVGDAAGDTFTGIEIVFATNFDDIITGTTGTNDLRGLGGDDELNGEAGNDRLYGGQGADILNGGDGIDAAYYSTAQAGVTLDLALGGTAGEAAGDTFSSIEWVFGSNFDDDITGDALANNLFGNGGNDILNGDDGNDRIQGGDGDDVINGGDGIDTIYGQAGNDILSGGLGNDFFFASAGGDSYDGGADFDTVSYLASSSGIVTDLGGVGTGGDASGDSYISIERLLATNFDDTVQGGSGDETIQGLGGNDILGGGAGSDSLFGGAGVDTFLYDTSSDGADVISDFRGGSLGDEVIVLTDSNPNFDSFAEVQAAATQVGNNVIIDFGGGNTLTLANYSLTYLNASAIQFGVSQKPLTDIFAQASSDSFEFGSLEDAVAASGLDLDLSALTDVEAQTLLAVAEFDMEYAMSLREIWEDIAEDGPSDIAAVADLFA